MFDLPSVEELDLTACADALAASVAAQRRVGAERLALAAHFADLHGPGSTPGRYGRMLPGGADGTPEVSEFAADGLGPLIEQSSHAAGALLRDALNLRHRHPRLWDAVMTGGVEDWKARKVAQACADLSCEQARWVDRITLEAVLGLPFGRALGVVEGKVVAADPDGHDARRRARGSERFVRTTRSDGAGLRMLHARTTAGDVARLEAMVGHLADLLARAGDTHDAQRRRATALGLLANPALACVLLAGDLAQTSRHSDHPAPTDTDHRQPEEERADVAGHRVVVGPVETADTEAAGPVAAAWVLGEALRSLGPEAVDRLRPRTVLYLHLAEEAVTTADGSGSHVLRCEGLGALTRRQLREWLGSDQVVVRPVIDLHGQEPADAYEIPHHLREAMILAQPFEVFPYGTTASRAGSIDADHTRPWIARDDGGPPGQTRLENLGPLARGHHRAKTFGGFACHQPLPGLFLWRTPTGHWYRVDHTGTTPLGRTTPDIIDQARSPASDLDGTSRHLHRLVRADWTTGEHHLSAVLEDRAA